MSDSNNYHWCEDDTVGVCICTEGVNYHTLPSATYEPSPSPPPNLHLITSPPHSNVFLHPLPSYTSSQHHPTPRSSSTPFLCHQPSLSSFPCTYSPSASVLFVNISIYCDQKLSETAVTVLTCVQEGRHVVPVVCVCVCVYMVPSKEVILQYIDDVVGCNDIVL